VTNWGGPYLAAMLLTSPEIDDPITAVEREAGTVRGIAGIVTHTAVPRLGTPVAVNLLLILFAGGNRERDPLTVSVMDPAGFSQELPPIGISVETVEAHAYRTRMEIQLYELRKQRER